MSDKSKNVKEMVGKCASYRVRSARLSQHSWKFRLHSRNVAQPTSAAQNRTTTPKHLRSWSYT